MNTTENSSRPTPIGAGRSSFALVDWSKVLSELGLKEGMIFLDLACGNGRYSIAASQVVGPRGLVYAADLWEEGINALREEIFVKRITHIHPLVADVSKHIPVEDNAVDVCLLATVLHDFVLSDLVDGVLRETRRVLRPETTLAVLEFKKVDGPPGPPITSRLSAEEVEKIITPYGFVKERATEVGPYNYLVMFSWWNPETNDRQDGCAEDLYDQHAEVAKENYVIHQVRSVK